MTAFDVRSSVDRLIVARADLLRMPVSERARGLAGAAGPRAIPEGLPDELSRVTGYSKPVIAAGLDHLFAAVTEDDLMAWWRRRERRDPRPGPVVVLSAGNIPGVGLFPAMGCLLAGVPVILKSSTAEPILAPAWRRRLQSVAPVLAEAVVCAAWKGGDTRIEDALFPGVERIFAYGHDSTLAGLEERHPGMVSGFGTGASFALVVAGSGMDREAARLIAHDAAIWDQQGCLSPHGVFVIGDFARADHFAEALAGEMEIAETRLPRGRLPGTEAAAVRRFRAEAEARMVNGEPVRLRTPRYASGRATITSTGATASMDWTVVTDTHGAFTASPGNRTLWVRPLPRREDLLPALARWRGRLQGAGVGPGAPLEKVAGVLNRAGVTHVVPAGTMQAPPIGWLNKGRDMMDELFTTERGRNG